MFKNKTIIYSVIFLLVGLTGGVAIGMYYGGALAVFQINGEMKNFRKSKEMIEEWEKQTGSGHANLLI